MVEIIPQEGRVPMQSTGQQFAGWQGAAMLNAGAFAA